MSLLAEEQNELSPWIVYYGSSTDIEAFSAYRMLVLDSDHHPPLDKLKAQGKVLLGYISLGEVESHRSYFQKVKSKGIFLGENSIWKGSYYVDIRSPFWQTLVIKELIPDLLKKGFDGLFLDTLDNPQFLENRDPKENKGMKSAAEKLVKTIRLYFPYQRLMLNRAFGLLDKVAPYIDMVLGESIYTDYDFDSQAYRLADPHRYENQVQLLKKAKEQNPSLGIYTLDYWQPNDKAMIKQIYRVQRNHGFIPYVATIKLDQIIKEPK